MSSSPRVSRELLSFTWYYIYVCIIFMYSLIYIIRLHLILYIYVYIFNVCINMYNIFTHIVYVCFNTLLNSILFSLTG